MGENLAQEIYVYFTIWSPSKYKQNNFHNLALKEWVIKNIKNVLSYSRLRLFNPKFLRKKADFYRLWNHNF